MGRALKITRRVLLLGSAAVAGGVVFGYWRYKTPHDNPLLENPQAGEAVLTPYVRIDAAGVTIITPRAEMGQGVHTTLAAMVAEELDIGLDSVRVEHGPASKAYFNAAIFEEAVPFAATDLSPLAERVRGVTRVPAKFLGMQLTGGSSSTPDAFVKMRKAGAAARDVLLTAAAEALGADKASLRTESGTVVSPDGQTRSYASLAPLAAGITVPRDPELKPRSEWKLLGRSQPRVDMLPKCTGTAEFSIDVRLENMLYATVRRNPRLGGGMRGFDDSAARSMTGVKDVVPLADGVAVVASNTWYALQAARAMSIDWEPAAYPKDIEQHFLAVLSAFEGDYDSRFHDEGDVDAALIEGADLEGEYRAPYLAHATMEPVNAVAWWRDGELDIWAGNQAPTQAVKDAAALADIDEDKVRVHTTYLGGGFGRRAEMDFIKTAVAVALANEGIPVKTTWSREEDMTHDAYRPLAVARFRAKLDEEAASALDLSLAAPSVFESQFSRLDMPTMGPDISIVQSAWDQPYGIPNHRVTGYRAPVMLPVSSWRSVGASQNGFFHESIVDELAHAAGKDPLDFRLEMLTDEVSRGVIEAVATLSDWGAPLSPGRGKGMAFVLSFGVPTAEVVEVVDTPNGIRVLNVWAAVDVGTALDPKNIEAQLQSGINFGLSAAIMSEITLSNAEIEQSNFHNYDALRLAQAPNIEVQVLENGHRIRGIGEPGTPPAAPALGNAIFAATGQRIRELPFKRHVRFDLAS
ncbi:MAG: molybdopterin cofactor-binding domain-containing protein [Pseudomonadota bacterium]